VTAVSAIGVFSTRVVRRAAVTWIASSEVACVVEAGGGGSCARACAIRTGMTAKIHAAILDLT